MKWYIMIISYPNILMYIFKLDCWISADILDKYGHMHTDVRAHALIVCIINSSGGSRVCGDMMQIKQLLKLDETSAVEVVT